MVKAVNIQNDPPTPEYVITLEETVTLPENVPSPGRENETIAQNGKTRADSLPGQTDEVMTQIISRPTGKDK